MDRTQLDPAVQRAMALYENSPVGTQLADAAERGGRCRRASQRFISALRECGTDGKLLEWAWLGEWHHAVLLADRNVVDWTASQFETTPDAIASCPYPRIETRAEAEERWGCAREVDPDDAWELSSGLPRLLPWAAARERMPERDSPDAARNRN